MKKCLIGQCDLTDRDVGPKMSEEDRGKFVAIDMDSGEWEVLDADGGGDRLLNRLPDV